MLKIVIAIGGASGAVYAKILLNKLQKVINDQHLAVGVVLKERRRLILVTRETPLSLIHINNMKAVTEAGGIICPATPSFYSQPTTVDEVAATVVDRVFDLAGIQSNSFRWGNEQ